MTCRRRLRQVPEIHQAHRRMVTAAAALALLLLLLCVLVLVMMSSPGICKNCFSNGVAILFAIVVGSAPGYEQLT